MPRLSIRLFGQFEAVLGGERRATFRTQKVQALLIFLAAEPSKVHQREALMALFWPELPAEAAQVNLRQIVYQFRRAIPEITTRDGQQAAPLFLSDRRTVMLNPKADVEVDALAFSRLIEQVKTHDHGRLLTCPACRRSLEEATDLYSGPFLAGFYLDDSNEFEDWAERRREQYRRRQMDALATLAEMYLNLGVYSRVQTYARRQLAIDDLDERAYRLLMEAMTRDGRRNEALVVFEDARRRLRDELDLSPSRQTLRLADHIRNDNLDSEATEPPAVRGYELREQLGAGAFGVVHRAYQSSVGREVAVKIIRPRYANHPDFIRRFETEAQTIARLEHPHILPLYDYWREPDNAYLVMRWLRGGSLEHLLAGGPLAPALAADVIDQIAAALHVAHREHIIHRDVKAANILLDEDGNAYLTDFSVAGEVPAGWPALALTNSPETLSPEHLLEEALTPLTDQYSLGVVAFQMLTGRPPFPRAVPAEDVRARILAEPLPSLTGTMPDLSPTLNEVLRRATAKDPRERYSAILDMARDFRRAATATTGPVALPDPPPAFGDIDNPYKGLRAFQESDAATFFGREELVDVLAAKFRQGSDGSADRFRVYRIEARSHLDDHAGPYTLVIEQMPDVWFPEIYKEYEGHYMDGPWQWDLYLYIDDGRLWSTYPFHGDLKMEAVPLSETEFVLLETSIMRMLRDEHGEVVGYEVLYGYQHPWGGQWIKGNRIGDVPPEYLAGLSKN